MEISPPTHMEISPGADVDIAVAENEHSQQPLNPENEDPIVKSHSQRSVAVIGATGVAGQQFVEALRGHPWFRITAVAASARSAGRSYADALRDPSSGARRWYCAEEPDETVLGLEVQNAADFDPTSVDVVFTAIESDAARELEPRLARHRPVFSTASAFRYEPDVPMVVPGVNLEHLEIIAEQKRGRGWEGFVVPLPNCTTVGLVVTLKPLLDTFGLKRVILTSMQGLSGAGRSPGVTAMDVLDNIMPFIPGEEEKVARETGKLLGRVSDGAFVPDPVPVRATCTRANVLEGHTEAVHVDLGRDASLEEVRAAFEGFGADFCRRGLPSCPEKMIELHDDPYRPQPRLDRDAGGGMTTSVGRLRLDEQGLRYLLVSHNTKMGAAKGAVLAAEHMLDSGTL
jgi:aspartate-semialdehyde dehydrogenase